MLDVLPKQMLVSQWREVVAIKRQWEKGTLKHRLVSYVMEHHKKYFAGYAFDVVNELEARKIKFNKKLLEEIVFFCVFVSPGNYDEHDDIYLRECLYNLEEKARRGIISKDEWGKIYEKFKDFTKLWEG